MKPLANDWAACEQAAFGIFARLVRGELLAGWRASRFHPFKVKADGVTAALALVGRGTPWAVALWAVDERVDTSRILPARWRPVRIALRRLILEAAS